MSAVTVPSWLSPRALIAAVLICLMLLAGASTGPSRVDAATPIYACVNNSTGQVFIRGTCLATETRFNLNDRVRPVSLTVMTASGQVYYRRAPSTGGRLTLSSPASAILRFCYVAGSSQPLHYFGTPCPAGWRVITVPQRNLVPDAVNDAGTGYKTTENTAFTTANVLANDTDRDGDTLTVSDYNRTSAGGAAVVRTGTGTFTYTPGNVFNGLAAGQTLTDQFNYVASDGFGGFDQATVSVTVTGVNDALTATDDAVTVSEDGPAISFNVLANDTDPDQADTLFLTDTDAFSTRGATSLFADGTTRYDPFDQFEALAVGETATDTFTYTASDGNGGTDTATVTITITGVNDAPTAVDDGGPGYFANEDDAFRVGNVLTNDTDPDGDTLTVSDVDATSAGGASVTSNGDGTFAYDPAGQFESLDNGEQATDQFAYTVSDGNGGTDTAIVSVVVTGINDAPTVADFAFSLDEGGSAEITLAGNDVEGDSLTFAVVDGPDHGTLTGTAPDLTYTPDADYSGPDAFTYRANDGDLDSAVGTASITVTPINDDPVAVDDTGTGFATNEDTAFTTADVLANDTDVDGDTLSVSDFDETSAGGASLSYNDDGTFDYDPGTAFAALDTGETDTDTFTYTVSDGNGGTDTATVTIAITGVNDRPTADDRDIDVDEDGSVAVTLTGADVDGDALTFAVVDEPANGTLSGTAPNLTYTPDADYTGADSFTYVANDGDLDSAEATVSITVGAVNDDPVAVNNAGAGFTTNENTAFTTGNVLTNDTDVDGDTLVVTSIFATTDIKGSLNDNGDGTVDYNPNGEFESLGAGESDEVTFNYTVSDGNGGTDTGTVTITITGVNDDPNAVADSATTGETSATAVDVLANDTDPESDTLSIDSVDTTDTQGAVSIATDGLSVSYDPNGAFDDLEDGETAEDTFTYTISDGNGGTDTATVTITIEGVTNLAPVADDQTVTTAEDTGVAITLTATDAEGDPVTFTVTTLPSAGTLYEGTDATGTVLTAPYDLAGDTVFFVPAADENGSAYATFDFVADDGIASDPATITVDVTAVNDAPAADAQSVTTNEDTARTITLSGTDADDDALTFAIGTGPSRGTLGTIGTPDCTTTANTCTATVTYTPTANLNGPDSFTFTVNDGTVGSAAATVAITVTAVNDVPVATGQSVTTNEDTPVTITLAATDADGQALTFAIDTAPTNGTLGSIGTPVCTAGNCTASVTYTPNANANGADSFTFTVNDGTATSTAATVSITITAVNDAPVLAAIETAALAFSEGNAPTAITTSLTVSDVDSATLTGASVVITAAGFVAGQDVLAFTAPAGSGITGSYNVTTGVLNLSGTASLADYQTALRSVTYANSSENPNTTSRVVVFQGNDGGTVDNLSNNATRTIAVTAVNDAPVNTRPSAVQTVNEDTNLVFNTANGNAISIADVDAGTAVVKLSLDVVNGTLTFPVTTGLTFVDGTGNGGASVHVTGTIASINTALNGLIYKGTANYNVSRGAESLSITTNDQGNTGSPGALATIDSVAITAAPVNDVPAAAARAFGPDSVETNMRRSVDVASGLLLGASDNDASDGGFTQDLDLGTVNGVAPVGGTITTTITGVGTVVADAETGAFTFDPAPGVVGNVSFPFTVCDNGNPLPSLCSTAVTASFNISGPVTWFVNPAATVNGDGRLSRPFTTLAGADAVDAANHRIFVYAGTTLGGITLNSGEWLIGQGVTDFASFDALMGITVPSGTIGRPAVGSGTARLQNTLTLNTNAVVKAVTLTTTTNTALNDPSGAITDVSVDQVRVTTTTGTGVNLSNIAGTLNFSSLTSTGGTGVNLSGSNGGATFTFTGVSISSGANTAFTATGGGTVNVTGSTNTLTTTSGTTLSLNGVAGALAFSNVAKNGAGTGIDLTNVGAEVAIAAGSIQNTTVNGISLNGSNGAFSYPGTVSGNTSGRTIQVQNRTGGTVTFSGAISGGGTGIFLGGNVAAATITFSANLTLATGTNPAFTVTGGGTVNVSGASKAFTTTGTGAGVNINSGTANVSFTGGGLVISTDDGTGFNATSGTVAVRGAGNTITSTGGAALNVVGATIGAAGTAPDSGLRFQSIAANGGTNGIVLNNTGTSGSLTVTGTGTAGSGGTIQNTTVAISLTNTTSPSFDRIAINNTTSSGINGREVTNFTLTNSTISNTGTAGGGGVADTAVFFATQSAANERNLTGVVTITGNTLTAMRHHGVSIANFAGTISDVTVSNNSITSPTTTAASRGTGIQLLTFATNASTKASITRATINDNDVFNFPSDAGIMVQCQNPNEGSAASICGAGGTNLVSITNNTISGQSPTNRMGTQGILFNANGTVTANFNVSGNTVTNIVGNAISHNVFGDSIVNSLTSNNTVTPSNQFGSAGIAGGLGETGGYATDTPTLNWTISGNNISATDGSGIRVVAGVDEEDGFLNVTIRNNIVAAPIGGFQGIRVAHNGSASDPSETDICGDIAGNTSAAGTTTPAVLGIGLRKAGTSTTDRAFGLEGLPAGSGSTPNVETYVNGQNPSGGGTLLVSATSGFTSCSSAP